MGKHNTYCVYVHIRLDTQNPFYVGMGSRSRAYEFGYARRNIVWNRIKKKTEITVDIIQDGLSKDDAYLLEMWMIAKFRHEGIFLANLTDGGEGSLSHIPRWRKKIYSLCESGIVKSYDSATCAARAVVGSPNAQGNISDAARGSKESAYGYVWWYEGDEPKKYVKKYHGTSMKLSKKVYTSLGEVFDSCVSAAKYINTIGEWKARPSSISRACLISTSMYGRAWSYDGVPNHPERTGRDAQPGARKYYKKPIYSNLGESFQSRDDAVIFLRLNGFPKANATYISAAAAGHRKSAYGRVWSYAPTNDLTPNDSDDNLSPSINSIANDSSLPALRQ